MVMELFGGAHSREGHGMAAGWGADQDAVLPLVRLGLAGREARGAPGGRRRGHDVAGDGGDGSSHRESPAAPRGSLSVHPWRL